MQFLIRVNAEGRHLAFSRRVWKPLLRICLTFLSAFPNTRHEWEVRNLACRFNQHPIPFTCACNSQWGFCIQHSYKNKPWGLQLAPILRGAQQETPLALTWSLGGPADAEKYLDIDSAQSPFYTRLSANTKLKPDGTCTTACSPGLPGLQLWDNWREDPVECNTLSLWLPHVTLHSFSLNTFH